MIIGIYYSAYLYFSIPSSTNNMNENDITELLLDQRLNKDMAIIAGILFGMGFLMMLISFGNNRYRGNVSKKEKTIK